MMTELSFWVIEVSHNVMPLHSIHPSVYSLNYLQCDPQKKERHTALE